MYVRVACFFIFFILSSCASKGPDILTSSTNPVSEAKYFMPFLDVIEYAPDDSYGLTEKNPVKVGGVKTNEGPSNQRRFIASLLGPNGEELSFHRRGSCCPYKSENGFGDTALIDVYEVWYNGLKKPVLLYISFYDTEKLYIPKGFIRTK